MSDSEAAGMPGFGLPGFATDAPTFPTPAPSTSVGPQRRGILANQRSSNRGPDFGALGVPSTTFNNTVQNWQPQYAADNKGRGNNDYNFAGGPVNKGKGKGWSALSAAPVQAYPFVGSRVTCQGTGVQGSW